MKITESYWENRRKREESHQVRVTLPKARKSDGRLIVTVKYANGIHRVVTFSKYVMETYVGRELHPNEETVDHIDRDINNNDISNLRIISRSAHTKQDIKRAILVEIECVLCGKKELKKANYLNHNAKQGKAGPFCGKSCAGKYGSAVQNGKIERLEAQPEVPLEKREYYYLDKENIRL